MCKMIVNQWKLEKIIVVVLACAIVFGTLIEGALSVSLYKTDGETGIGGMVPMGISLIVLMFVGISSFSQGYNQAVALGRARKNYVIAYYINIVLCTVGCILGSLLTDMANSVICSTILKTDTWKKSFINIFFDNLPLVIIGVLLYAAAMMCISGLYLRFGKVAFWIIWGLYMVGVFAGPGLLARKNIKITITKEMVQQLQGTLGIAIGLTATMILLVVTWAITYKAEVKNY